MNWLVILITVIGGIAVGTQAAVNGALGLRIGRLEASFISFLLGALALGLLTGLWGSGHLRAALTVPRWQLIGGLLGAGYVFILVFAVPKIGVSATVLGIIAGQMLAGAVIDHFGLTGTPVPFGLQRLLALGFMGAALYLFNRRL